MNICFVINENYIGQLKVALYSLFDTHKEKLDIYVLEHDLSEDGKKDLDDFTSKFNQKLNYIFMPDDLFIGLPKMGYDNSYTAYFKIMIPYVLNHLDKVLYLDCDLIINKNLHDLYDVDPKHFLSAVIDTNLMIKRKEHCNKITRGNYNYFNSGVILFDFKYKDEIIRQEEYNNYINNQGDEIVFHDQDILNHFYAPITNFISKDFNNITIYDSKLDFIIRKKNKNAYIIHYANWKPWNSNYIGKYYKLYYNYYKKTKKITNVTFLKKRRLKDQFKLLLKYIKR